MIAVKIADLKAHLSRHLQAIRRGETITVLDRETPIARIIPVEAAQSSLVVHAPADRRRRLGDVPLPKRPAKLKNDAVTQLLLDRQVDR